MTPLLVSILLSAVTSALLTLAWIAILGFPWEEKSRKRR